MLETAPVFFMRECLLSVFANGLEDYAILRRWRS
ncbi:hypothetical protein HCH_00122 [Hahella chejuensis KCTC 2396]|uniref:Uncharacterized protein n=1 Tax=Hahella chejuensis (strain KCTC 2396) TaxID=349521 RepID=Q2SQN2_HAHCH|nr:hypothetical protein HCH_00122 [Hahella chejuensis KCTC 2396]